MREVKLALSVRHRKIPPASWKRLSGWQVFGWIDRFALAANFKVQLDTVCVAVAHLSDLLTFFNALVFLDHQGLVVRVSCQERVVVFKDDQVTVATQSRTGINHLPVCRRNHGITGLTRDIKALIFDLIETGNQGALRGPDPGNVIVTGWRCRQYRSSYWGRGGCGGRRMPCCAGRSRSVSTRCRSCRTWRDRARHTTGSLLAGGTTRNT